MMAKMEYLRTTPTTDATIPTGRVLVHNNVRPTQRLRSRGFRAWTQLPTDRLEVCDCAWAPDITTHYRVAPITLSS